MVTVEVDACRAVAELHEREVMLGLLTHDEWLEYLTHSLATAGRRVATDEPLEVDIEGHGQTVPRRMRERTQLPQGGWRDKAWRSGGWVGHDVLVMLLVPADALHPLRPDEHFAAEASAAREAGLDVALVDHDALTRPDCAQRAVARVPAGGEAVYRGWMLRAEQYGAFADALAERGVRLRTTAEQYRRAHELPGWYPALLDVTPRSVWTAGADRADFDRARVELGPGPAVLRDYVKSMKHY